MTANRVFVGLVSLAACLLVTGTASAQTVSKIDLLGSQTGGACNGVADVNCTCQSWQWFCSAGETCTVYAYPICIVG